MSDTRVDVTGTGEILDQGSPQEDPAVPVRVNGQSDPKVYTEEDIQKAREQEKSKLYKRLETMQETVRTLEQERQARLDAEREAAEQKEREELQRQESEMSVKDLLAKKESEWQQQMQAIQQQVEQERALREQESRYAQLMDYRQQTIAQYSDRVAPELLDLIDGDTPEEIAQAAEDMAGRTERILAQTQEALQNTRQAMPTVRATAPASGENSASHRSYSPDEIRGMSMKEYAKQRQSLLGKGANGPKNRGLFG